MFYAWQQEAYVGLDSARPAAEEQSQKLKNKMRYKLTIEYDGTNYCGFQKQFDILEKSVEEVLEDAVFKLAQEKVKIIASGRTDAGVHALGQVVHFDLSKNLPDYKMVLGLNSYLHGTDVVAIACESVDENFHARFNSKMRHYSYKIVNRIAPLTLQKHYAWQVSRQLDLGAMITAAQFLIGEHDFSSFRDSQCQGKSPVKTISKIEISQSGSEILVKVSAKSFLHHMVRNIVGTLVWVGSGKLTALDVKKILEAKDRTKSGPNAPACGLYFLGVDY